MTDACDRIGTVGALPSVEAWRSLPDPIARVRDTWPRPTPNLFFSVLGLPAPQGSKEFKGRANNGRPIMVESSKALAPWRVSVEQAALREVSPDGDARILYPGFPLGGPLVAEFVFTMKKPGAAPKKRRTWAATKIRDLSKLARAVEDSLITAGAIEDDGLIVEYARLAKVFPLEDRDALSVPGVVIRVWSVHSLM